ncbi:L,D-transpeptidase family protein [Roseibacillus persicicus]|uniref:L,D-transpeptidase family protein n=1 Tax=Roseibacillus persicicus TaxID=454148 RepID=UPI0028100F0D|nr:L,D-transpeptidase family protein [Roseibacillus persicicus]MDQ8189480.1 L,D-transpeptidase family protein [Roseibacillus persicicus]
MKIIVALLLAIGPLFGFELPQSTSQAIVGLAGDWNSSHVTLQLYQKDAGGTWTQVSKPWKGRLGSAGLAWGRGLHPLPAGVTLKKEGDRRAPAGVFTLGGAWGYAEKIKHHPNLSYTQITRRDLWVEDPTSRSYNQHIRLDHEPSTTWEKKQQMRQGDTAHSLKLFINHNAPHSIPGAGSAIFFHIWRGGGSKATFGCTTMQESNLAAIIQWLDPSKNPVYILLPQKEYLAKRAGWKLP